jgi:hypothetical protein
MSFTDPNEDYTGILIKDTYQSVLHIGGVGEFSSSVYDGTGSLVNISWNNISQSLYNKNVSFKDANFNGTVNIDGNLIVNGVEIQSNPSTYTKTETITLTEFDIANKFVTSSIQIFDPNSVILDIEGAPAQMINYDYEVSSSVISWNGFSLDELVEVGEVVRLCYLTNN